MKVVSMRGEVLDMGRMIAQNEKTVALGNASMNARGDIVGPGGKIIKRREQVATEYYAANPKAVKQVALRDISKEVFASPAEAVETITQEVKKQNAAAAVQEQQIVSQQPRRRKTEDKED